ncbi:MAG: hypothetical protein HDS68_05700 [Bacteroidales bacterium]|nr:hypothetical protein [Bacteroidales bacterium]
MIKKTLIFAASVVMLAACSNDDDPVRENVIRRTVELGKTSVLPQGKNTCDNVFVGVIEQGETSEIFVSKHLGTCMVVNDTHPDGRYRITVDGGTNPFTDLTLDFGMTEEAFVETYTRAEKVSDNPLTYSYEVSEDLVYTYTFVNGSYASVTTTFESDALGKDGDELLLEFMNARYAEDETAFGTWYNAYSADKATVKATLQSDGDLWTLTVRAL